MSERITLDEFVSRTSLVMKCSAVSHNPQRDESDTSQSDHWLVTLNTSRRQMSFYYSSGIYNREFSRLKALTLGLNTSRSGLTDGTTLGNWSQNRWSRTLWGAELKAAFVPVEPTIAEVLYCLASNATGWMATPTFEEWAPEYGYNVDSIKAKKTFDLTARLTSKLRAMLGNEWFNLLLEDVENDG